MSAVPLRLSQRAHHPTQLPQSVQPRDARFHKLRGEPDIGAPVHPAVFALRSTLPKADPGPAFALPALSSSSCGGRSVPARRVAEGSAPSSSGRPSLPAAGAPAPSRRRSEGRCWRNSVAEVSIPEVTALDGSACPLSLKRSLSGITEQLEHFQSRPGPVRGKQVPRMGTGPIPPPSHLSKSGDRSDSEASTLGPAW